MLTCSMIAFIFHLSKMRQYPSVCSWPHVLQGSEDTSKFKNFQASWSPTSEARRQVYRKKPSLVILGNIFSVMLWH